jgi:flagellar protein FlbD
VVRLTRLNGEVFFLNVDMVERVDARKDTTIFTIGGNVYTVAETAEEVASAVRVEKAAIMRLRPEAGGRPVLHVLDGDNNDE